jgi:pimeloyl-ACP methyl ester carboxylesterase
MDTNLTELTSPDGTTLAVETVGTGPPLVLVVGAFCDRSTTRPLAGLLADRFTVHAYDRRGRGASSDNPDYAVHHEIDDLAAVLDQAGGNPGLYGHSSGAILALRAAAAGLPISRVAAYEPPWDDRADPAHNAAIAHRIDTLVRQHDFDAATKHFLTAALELPPTVVDQMAASPYWARMAGMAPTLRYECAITADQRIPTAALATLTVPALLLAGGDSDPWARDTVAVAAAAIPGAGTLLVPGQTHSVDPTALAPLLAEFFGV